MRSLCIQTEHLTAQNLNLLQSTDHLQSTLRLLRYMQNFPFSMDRDTNITLIHLQQRLRLLQERLLAIDRYVKDSAYVYETTEKQLIQKANDVHPFVSLCELAQKVVQGEGEILQEVLHEGLTNLRKEDDANRESWNVSFLDGHFDPTYQFLSKRTLRSLINQGISASVDAGFHLVRLSKISEREDMQASAEFAIGNAELSGTAHGVLFDEQYRFHPEIQAQATAYASAISALIRMDWQNDLIRTQTSAQGEIATAYASGEARINQEEITLKGEVGAALAQGEVKGVLEVWGVSVTVSTEGEIGGVGIGGAFSTSADAFEIGGKLSCLLGMGINIRIDW